MFCLLYDGKIRGGWGKVPGDYFYADPGFKYLDKVLVGAD